MSDNKIDLILQVKNDKEIDRCLTLQNEGVTHYVLAQCVTCMHFSLGK